MKVFSYTILVAAISVLFSCSESSSQNIAKKSESSVASAFSKPLDESKIDEYIKSAKKGDVDAALSLYKHYSYLEYENRMESKIWLEASAKLGSPNGVQLFIIQNSSEGKCDLAEKMLNDSRNVIEKMTKSSISELNYSVEKCRLNIAYRLKNGRSPPEDK